MPSGRNVVLDQYNCCTPVLTEAGRALAAQAREVLRQAELFERTAIAISGGLEPELTFAVDNIVPSDPVIGSLAALPKRYPDVAVIVETGNESWRFKIHAAA